MHRRRLLAATAVLGLLPALAWAQGAASDPTAFVDNFAQEGIVKILEAKISQGEKTERFRTLFKERFDIPAIARFVLGRYWRTAQPAEQEKFLKVFEDVIVYTWARRFSEYNGQTLKVSNTAPDGEDGALVNSRIVGKSADQSFGVAWRLRKRDDGWRVVDVIVDGVSMAITYRQEYASIIAQQGGMPGLIGQLEIRAKDLGKQQGVG
jgi:phospholipid transport system substrate-binding protein